MKFIVDAQLPFALAAFLRGKGYDALHTKELPNGNDSTDAEINKLSISENRVVISKDGDFYNSYTGKREPYKLLYIKTGNITNAKLLDVFDKNLSEILSELEKSDVVTVDQRYIIALQ